MQRLLTVTYGYLRFVTICMLGGAAIFFLTALAVTDLKTS